MKVHFLTYLFSVLFFSCTANMPITYKTHDLKPDLEEETIPILLNINDLNDQRDEIKSNGRLFDNPRQLKIVGDNYCINSERHYKNEPVGSQISKIMAEHFNRIQLFNFTTYNKENLTNFYITGNITRFYAEQEFSESSAALTQFGLVGGIAASFIKTPALVEIEITDLRLYNKDNELIMNFGDFYDTYEDEMKADAGCWCAFWSANEKLKIFIDELANQIRDQLKSVEFEKSTQ